MKLGGCGVKDAIVVERVEKRAARDVVVALRVHTADSILADGIFNDRATGSTHCIHAEGAWCFAWEERSGRVVEAECNEERHEEKHCA